MRKFLTGLVLIPLGLIFIDFAVANRHLVTVSFDPFGSGDTAFDLPPVPLFAIIIVAVMVGVVAGGSATWFRQRRWRRAARHHEADARQARAQLAELRTGTMTPSGYQPQRLPAPSQAGSYGAAGRDKQGATL
ncbi:lipopolysaccharide assembly protein LapA domain-containing protein [Bradyrhizobium sp. dw_411]|uniref:lipopolysaccharide assembly protein LapA domain-containing protein n=1 Tax=Bradyrhizobium sp. dw_411 TaxID=2720082 RepID=UPI001BCC625D|nr:lipopolysaccharide assembly protein LapA domain-containing protein [Bradyrhizobium sp. dw_411]